MSTCGTCGTELQPERPSPCPGCGALGIIAVEEVQIFDGLRKKYCGPTGFVESDVKAKSKISGGTKRKAYEVHIIDRTDPEFTRKVHAVQEEDEHGQWQEVHHHEETFRARRRPPKAG